MPVPKIVKGGLGKVSSTAIFPCRCRSGVDRTPSYPLTLLVIEQSMVGKTKKSEVPRFNVRYLTAFDSTSPVPCYEKIKPPNSYYNKKKAPNSSCTSGAIHTKFRHFLHLEPTSGQLLLQYSTTSTTPWTNTHHDNKHNQHPRTSSQLPVQLLLQYSTTSAAPRTKTHNNNKYTVQHPRTLSRFGPNLAARSVAHENSSRSTGARAPPPSSPSASPPAVLSTSAGGPRAATDTAPPPNLAAMTALKPSGGGCANGDWPRLTITASPSSRDSAGKNPGSS